MSGDIFIPRMAPVDCVLAIVIIVFVVLVVMVTVFQVVDERAYRRRMRVTEIDPKLRSSEWKNNFKGFKKIKRKGAKK